MGRRCNYGLMARQSHNAHIQKAAEQQSTDEGGPKQKKDRNVHSAAVYAVAVQYR